MNERRKFGGVQAGRGIAALLVVCAHLGSIVAEPRFYGTQLFGGRLSGFGVGVDFFFVLSGFVIAWVHWADIGDRSRLGRYITSRVVRIYPAYLIVLLPLSALYFTFPAAGIPSQHDPLNLVFSALLLPYPVHPILGVAWTLVHEMLFYAVFAVIIRFGRRALWLLPAWGATILFLHRGGLATLPYPADILFSGRNLEFLLGIVCARLLATRRIAWPHTLAMGGAVLFLLAMMLGGDLPDRPLAGRIVFGGSAAVFILGIVEIERSHGLHVPRALMLLGEASYAIYLVHGVVLSATIEVFVHAWHGAPLPVVVVGLLTAATLAGIAFHLLIEQPVGRWLATHLRRPAAMPRTPMPL